MKSTYYSPDLENSIMECKKKQYTNQAGPVGLAIDILRVLTCREHVGTVPIFFI